MTPEGITQAVQPDHSDGHGGEVRAESAVARADRGSPHDHRHETTSRLFEKGLNPMEMAVIVEHKEARDAEALYVSPGGGQAAREGLIYSCLQSHPGAASFVEAETLRGDGADRCPQGPLFRRGSPLSSSSADFGRTFPTRLATAVVAPCTDSPVRRPRTARGRSWPSPGNGPW